MKKSACLICLLFFLIYCGPKHAEVERIIEDGVEVVINHLEPYKIGGRNSLILVEILNIDSEQEETLNLGIPDILGFDVNSIGEIFLVTGYAGEGNFIYKFDGKGDFIKSFGIQGEGPGELQNPHHITLDSNGNILITDLGRYPLQKYNQAGDFIGGYEITHGVSRIVSGPEGNILVHFMSVDQSITGPTYNFILNLLTPELQVIKVLEKLSFSPRMEPWKISGIEPMFFWSVSKDDIFVATEERGYEVWVYDSHGTLKRKIRKEYEQNHMTQDIRDILSTKFRRDLKNVLSFPEYLPPIQSIVAGDDGILLVATYDEGDGPGEFMFDVFNEEGVFVGQKSLNTYFWVGHMWMRIRAGKLYSLEVKESGFKVLRIYKMIWQ